MNVYADETRNAYEAVLDWLKEWACSRQFGLGSKLPWDKEWLIAFRFYDYMAYYTIAHLLQGGIENINGKSTGPSGIPSSAVTDAMWDYIMLGIGAPGDFENVDSGVLEKMRREFLYWFPVNLRVSGYGLQGE